jgi:dTMP kinase
MRLVVLEGMEGCGKTTACEPLVKRLATKGVKADWRREPGGTRIGEDMRTFLLSHREAEPMSLFYGFQIARVELLADMLRTKDVDLFVMDRFWPSTWAYQVMGEGISKGIFDAAQEAILPYVTRFSRVDMFYLDCPDSIRLERMKKSGKGADRYESKPPVYHQRIREGYEDLVSMMALQRVDASKPQDEVLSEILVKLGL